MDAQTTPLQVADRQYKIIEKNLNLPLVKRGKQTTLQTDTPGRKFSSESNPIEFDSDLASKLQKVSNLNPVKMNLRSNSPNIVNVGRTIAFDTLEAKHILVKINTHDLGLL